MIAFVSGCFDLFHVGHLALLRQAKGLCDTVVVGLNSDKSAHQLKGRWPIIGQKDRQAILVACRYVSECHIFDEPTPIRLINTFKPKLLIRGYDGAPVEEVPGHAEMLTWGGKIVSLNKVYGLSTSTIIARIRA